MLVCIKLHMLTSVQAAALPKSWTVNVQILSLVISGLSCHSDGKLVMSFIFRTTG